MIIIRIRGLETVIYVCGKYPRLSVYGHQVICQFLALQYCDLKTRKIEFKCDRRKNEGPKAQVFLYLPKPCNTPFDRAVLGANSVKLKTALQTQSVRNELYYCKAHKNIELGNSIHTHNLLLFANIIFLLES